MGNKYYTLDIVKLFLLLGVVSIHSNILTPNVTSLPSFGSNFVSFLSSSLTSICVPTFFIISGFLFFLNQNEFSLKTYSDKLYRRFYTLFIPYILWNLISLILQIIKIKYLDFPNPGLYQNGSIQWIKVIEGFYNYVDGYPFAFAFWFIRNLMIFILFSPIAYFIGCKKLWIGLIFIFICCLLNTTLWGFCFYVIGGMLSRYCKNQLFQISIYPALACGFLWIVISIINLHFQFAFLYSTILIIESIAALIFIIYILPFLKDGGIIGFIIEKIVPATFFIYSFHQLGCSVIRNFFIEIFGLTTSIGMILAYCFSFITLVVLSYLLWLILKCTCPLILNILCGKRGVPVKKYVFPLYRNKGQWSQNIIK